MADSTDNVPQNQPLDTEMTSDQPFSSKHELVGGIDVEVVHQISWNWAYFELSVQPPHLAPFASPVMLFPETVPDSDEKEFVYPICDYGNRLSTSKGPEMYEVGRSMCKFFYTIEKIIAILIERLQSSGIPPQTEVQVTFDGHLLAQRKAFESVINLNYNVIVTNFDPGAWGERYLAIVKRLADRGYGYPTETPRNIYRTVVSKPALRVK